MKSQVTRLKGQYPERDVRMPLLISSLFLGHIINHKCSLIHLYRIGKFDVNTRMLEFHRLSFMEDRQSPGVPYLPWVVTFFTQHFVYLLKKEICAKPAG